MTQTIATAVIRVISVVPSGFVTSTFRLRHLSPPRPPDPGGTQLTQNSTKHSCPMPTGLGEAMMYEYVGMVHAGSCADTVDKVRVVTENVRIRIKAKVVVFVLLKFIFIFLFPFFF